MVGHGQEPGRALERVRAARLEVEGTQPPVLQLAHKVLDSGVDILYFEQSFLKKLQAELDNFHFDVIFTEPNNSQPCLGADTLCKVELPLV